MHSFIYSLIYVIYSFVAPLYFGCSISFMDVETVATVTSLCLNTVSQFCCVSGAHL